MQRVDRLSVFTAGFQKKDGSWPRWVHLVRALRNGPKTTGQLGFVRGIGENVRGIRIEANRHLPKIDLWIKSESTDLTDADGKVISNATYRLIDLRLQPHLERTQRTLQQMGLEA